MADIEARIAELLHQRLEGRQVVDIADVEHVIGVMGQPEDFGEGEGAEEHGDRDRDQAHGQVAAGDCIRDPDDRGWAACWAASRPTSTSIR